MQELIFGLIGGTALLMYGVKLMGEGLEKASGDTMKKVLTVLTGNVWSAFLVGIFITAIVQSSTAVTVMAVGFVSSGLMNFSQAGLLDLQAAIYIILGNNIGTCFTAQLASMTGSVDARRTAWGHTLYNVIGVVAILIGLPVFLKIVITATDYIYPNPNVSVYVANSHTLFNVINALMFLPLTKYYVLFLNKIIREKDDVNVKRVVLDKLLLVTPVAALEASRAKLVSGVEILEEMIKDIMYIIYTGDEKKMVAIVENEDTINHMQKDLTRYLVDVSRKGLTEGQSMMVPAMITSMNNIERSGDRIMEISTLYNKKKDGDLAFTSIAINELKELEENIINLFQNTIITL